MTINRRSFFRLIGLAAPAAVLAKHAVAEAPAELPAVQEFRVGKTYIISPQMTATFPPSTITVYGTGGSSGLADRFVTDTKSGARKGC